MGAATIIKMKPSDMSLLDSLELVPPTGCDWWIVAGKADLLAGHSYWILQVLDSSTYQQLSIDIQKMSDMTEDSLLVIPTVATHGETPATYTCIKAHSSAIPATEPGVGEDWETYWSLSGTGGEAWDNDSFYANTYSPAICIPMASAIDTLNKFLYFVIDSVLIKVDLATLTVADMLELTVIVGVLSMSIDEVGGFLYLNHSISVTKVDLSDLTEAGIVDLAAGDFGYSSSIQ